MTAAGTPGGSPSSDSGPASVKSAVRTLLLLEVLADRGGVPARLTELADELGAPRSSVHALLRTLCAAGWVRTDAAGTQYALGLRTLLVGTSILDTDPYVRAARPVLEALRDQLRETVHLARLDGSRVVYLTTHESGRDPRRISRVGRYLPAHTTSLGKALLAARGERPTGSLRALTPRTLTSVTDLAAELDRTVTRGYAVDDEENTPGLRCLGVALRYTDPVRDAISCSVPVDRLSPDREQEIVAALRLARARIEESAPVQGVL